MNLLKNFYGEEKKQIRERVHSIIYNKRPQSLSITKESDLIIEKLFEDWGVYNG